MYSIRKSLEMAKCSSLSTVRERGYPLIISLIFLKKKEKKKIPLDPGASWLYKVSQNASEFYIWRVRIKLP